MRRELLISTNEHLGSSYDISKSALLNTIDIAITSKNHFTIINGGDAMKHIFAWGNLSQHGIAFFKFLHFGDEPCAMVDVPQDRLIATQALKKPFPQL